MSTAISLPPPLPVASSTTMSKGDVLYNAVPDICLPKIVQNPSATSTPRVGRPASSSSTDDVSPPSIEQRTKGGSNDAAVMNIYSESPKSPRRKKTSSKDYNKKNKAYLEQLKERRNKELELLEEERRREERTREKLRNIVLSRASSFKAGRESDTEKDEETVPATTATTNTPTTKRIKRTRKPSLKNEEDNDLVEETETDLLQEMEVALADDKETQEQLVNFLVANADMADMVDAEADADVDADRMDKDMKEKAKIKKFFRNRYSSFLATLKDNLRAKQEAEEKKKRKKELKLKKLREEIGITNVSSRLFAAKQPSEVSENIPINNNNNNHNGAEANVGSQENQKTNLPPPAPAPQRGVLVARTIIRTSKHKSPLTRRTVSRPVAMKGYHTDSSGPIKHEPSGDSSSDEGRVLKSDNSGGTLATLNGSNKENKTEDDDKLAAIQRRELAEKIVQRQQQYIEAMKLKKAKQLHKQEAEKQRQKRLRAKVRDAVLSLCQTKPKPLELPIDSGSEADDNADATVVRKPRRTSNKKKTKLTNEDATSDNNTNENGEGGEEDDELESDSGSDKKTDRRKKANRFLNRMTVPKRQISALVTDFAQWKKRQHIEADTKVFIVLGGYHDIKKALLKRGWFENPEPNSPFFDMKWTLKAKDIDHSQLTENQIVNHFEKSTEITTKVGLCHNLRNLMWYANVDVDTFYPRCFDLNDPDETANFLDDFKAVKAESILKLYVQQSKKASIEPMIAFEVVKVALEVTKRRLQDIDDIIDDLDNASDQLVTEEEWEILKSIDPARPSAAERGSWEAWYKRYQEKIRATKGKKTKTKKKKKKKSKNKKQSNKQTDDKKDGQTDNASDSEEEEMKEQPNERDGCLAEAESTLAELRAKYPQADLNGTCNAWIVKPAGKSRGRGIACFNNLDLLQDHTKGKEYQWVAQKYMENPLIVAKRKFDIRQWVLVTDWNPLSIWFYMDCYLRFGVEEFSLDNLDNKFIHLTNNSIAKYSEKFEESEIEGSMWDSQTFEKHLEEREGYNVWRDKIQPQMKAIVTWSLECVQDAVENRKNSAELYGYDLMIDENYKVWLIEINSSPAMDYSTPITKRMVKAVSEDTVKVLADYNMAPPKKRASVDTGRFELIHKNKRQVDRPQQAFGLNLLCEGRAIK